MPDENLFGGLKGVARDWAVHNETAVPRLHYRTGFDAIDCLIEGGIEQRSLVTIGGLTGTGKTPAMAALAVGLARGGTPVTFAPLELGEEEMRNRLISFQYRMSYKTFESDLESGVEEYSERARAALKTIGDLPLRIMKGITRRNRVTARECFERAWRQRSRVLLIDHARYLDGWRTASKSDGRPPAEVVSDEIAMLVESSGITCIIAQQLDSRRIRVGERPREMHLMDTQTLAQHSDLVILLHRPFADNDENSSIAEWIVDKNRRGPRAIVHMHWRGAGMVYSPMDAMSALVAPCCMKREKKGAHV